MSMPIAGEKRTLTEEERIRFEEEERQTKASRGMLEHRVQAVQQDLETAQMQERQLKEQIERIGGQIKSQKENRARQITLQLELNKSLSKTREAYMKVVGESMASGTLSPMEGISLMMDETVKEILTLDEMDGPHANHRCRGLRNTCLDIRTFFPQSKPAASSQANDDNPQTSDSITQSTCPTYMTQGRCFDIDCPHHSSGEPRIPPQLEPLPDPVLLDLGVVEDGEMTPRGSTISAWWLENDGKIMFPFHTAAFSVESVMETIGVRTVDQKLLLERASSETASATDNIARYVDGFLLGLHAGLLSGPFDLQYFVTLLEDLSFPPTLVQQVRKDFEVVATLAWPDTCPENFSTQIEFLRATFAQEKFGEIVSNESRGDEEYMDSFLQTWKDKKKELSSIACGKTRKIETLGILLPVCRSVLQALGRAADAVGCGQLGDLQSVYHKIDQSLSLLCLTFDEDSFSRILLTPLFAANVALACNLKLYHTAHSRLESLLNHQKDQEKAGEGANFFILSQVLWSQLLQLRMCLPPVNVVSEQLTAYKTSLYSYIEDLNIIPRQVKPVVGRVK